MSGRADIVIVGAGAAGLMCAGVAAQRGQRVIVLEHTRTIGAKILISGGGRCNFTNLDIRPDRFVSENPHFAKSALARYTQHDVIALVKKHGVPFYEKTLGQLFCDGAGAARRIVDLLVAEAHGADIRTGQTIGAIEARSPGFRIATPSGVIETAALVIASGGLSIPKLGATDFAYRMARQFDLPVVAPRPALTPLTFAEADRAWMASLAGVSVEAIVACGKAQFREGLLFTHRGLSGPSILQISTYWRRGDAIRVNTLPDIAAASAFITAKRERPRSQLRTLLKAHLPERVITMMEPDGPLAAPAPLDRPLADIKDAALIAAADHLTSLTFVPSGDEGYAKAEVTAGGVDTRALSSQTMQAKTVDGLYVIGEAVDVTGWLGGYNFQWAWSSGWAAAQAIAARA